MKEYDERGKMNKGGGIGGAYKGDARAGRRGREKRIDWSTS